MCNLINTHTHTHTHTQFNKYTHTHTQALVEDRAAFAAMMFSSLVLAQVFSTLHTSADRPALGQNARSLACGNIFRRVIGSVVCRRYGKKLADYFQPWCQYSVTISGEVATIALTATLGFEEGCAILSYDGANAFNSIYRHRQAPASASGNRSFSSPLRIKPVRTKTRKPPMCIRWRRFGSGWVSAGSAARMQSGPYLLQRRLPQDLKIVQG